MSDDDFEKRMKRMHNYEMRRYFNTIKLELMRNINHNTEIKNRRNNQLYEIRNYGNGDKSTVGNMLDKEFKLYGMYFNQNEDNDYSDVEV